MQVLSTKILSDAQKSLFDGTDIKLYHHDFIQILAKDFSFPNTLEHCIFTSQNTVRIFVEKANELGVNLKSIKAYCVGVKTAQLLKSHGIDLVYPTDYASDLAEYLIANHSKLHFTFFCGNMRLDTLPLAFYQNKISYTEIQLYEVQLTSIKFTNNWNAVLFFSPSGVESFLQQNMLSKDTTAVCIGTTTASAVNRFTENIKISTETTVESVLQKMREIVYAQGCSNKKI